MSWWTRLFSKKPEPIALPPKAEEPHPDNPPTEREWWGMYEENLKLKAANDNILKECVRLREENIQIKDENENLQHLQNTNLALQDWAAKMLNDVEARASETADEHRKEMLQMLEGFQEYEKIVEELETSVTQKDQRIEKLITALRAANIDNRRLERELNTALYQSRDVRVR